jgi:hypothetical protein
MNCADIRLLIPIGSLRPASWEENEISKGAGAGVK